MNDSKRWATEVDKYKKKQAKTKAKEKGKEREARGRKRNRSPSPSRSIALSRSPSPPSPPSRLTRAESRSRSDERRSRRRSPSPAPGSRRRPTWEGAEGSRGDRAKSAERPKKRARWADDTVDRAEGTSNRDVSSPPARKPRQKDASKAALLKKAEQYLAEPVTESGASTSASSGSKKELSVFRLVNGAERSPYLYGKLIKVTQGLERREAVNELFYYHPNKSQWILLPTKYTCVLEDGALDVYDKYKDRWGL